MLNFQLFKGRFRGLTYFLILYLFVSILTRSILLIVSLAETDVTILDFFLIYFFGIVFDFSTIGYIAVPFVIYLIIMPDGVFNHKVHRIISYAVYFIVTALVIFGVFSDYLFWDEFQARFNFIAVDYLIYTSEVTGNIWESYPIPLILTVILLCAGGIMYIVIKKGILDASFTSKSTFEGRLKLGVAILLVPVVLFISLNQNITESIFKKNRYQQELSKNGLYSLFSAFYNNELDYEKFYLQEDEGQVFKRLRNLLFTKNTQYGNETLPGITRRIVANGPEKRYNVMFICVESFSAKYMSYFGEERNITPYLDSLVDSTLFFTKLFATGTRTVRGMEALTLSVPPSPGRSIVKRPNNENLFSPGFLFKERGYDTRFIYGGYGYFDNMNYFFENNGFNIVDRNDMTDDEITFANVWGVSDEDLFNKAIKESDSSHSGGKPFFNYIMTTSNHRPFTYPEGRIDVPSHEGRHGGVKYTDYAINDFLKKSSAKPWFDSTIFVIVADHCGSSAGKAGLEVSKYHIPMFIYAPHIIKPAKIDRLCSQIDVVPTILGMLNWSYESKFFGKDILNMTDSEERALVGNYQKLGLMTNNELCVLSVQNQADFYSLDDKWQQKPSMSKNSDMLLNTISYYQGQAILHKKKLNLIDGI